MWQANKNEEEGDTIVEAKYSSIERAISFCPLLPFFFSVTSDSSLGTARVRAYARHVELPYYGTSDPLPGARRVCERYAKRPSDNATPTQDNFSQISAGLRAARGRRCGNPIARARSSFDVAVPFSSEPTYLIAPTFAPSSILQLQQILLSGNTAFKSTWDDTRYDWLPGPKEIPKMLGEKLDEAYLETLTVRTQADYAVRVVASLLCNVRRQ